MKRRKLKRIKMHYSGYLRVKTKERTLKIRTRLIWQARIIMIIDRMNHLTRKRKMTMMDLSKRIYLIC